MSVGRPIVGAVLAGGAARRMGGAKAGLPLAGRALVEYPLAAVAAAGLEPVVVAKRASPLPSLDFPVWQEPDTPSHPLCGIVAALRQARGRAVVAVGCDMPFVTAALVARLADLEARLVAPLIHGAFEPLLARYEPSLVPALEGALDGRASIRETIAALDPVPLRETELAPFGDPGRLLFNVNTPHDLERAERALSRRLRSSCAAADGSPARRRDA